jgi:uncharacterized protein YciI
MGQVALRRTAVDLAGVSLSLRAAHARFLAARRAVLVTFGPIFTVDGRPAGYVYQTDFPGTTADAMTPFLADDPFGREGLYTTSFVSGWKCALAHRQPTLPARPNLQGFFFHGTAVPNATARRNAIVDAHRAHLMPKDDSNCVARGPLTDASGEPWLGSAMVYEFADRAALDAFFRDEPYCVNGIYQTIEIYDWRRGEMASDS